ncbi:energy-coupling factor transport system permease protein [Desulfohalotomaculum tongense]|uniref:energy-coupling factor transporter transmembrane component T n=1 Tax=Desulforadius tongensis TaxID=1216062 RepID=UPI001959BF3F|nr:energy-coupling factor transporter transmembrane component T [Desulforadius tongensis]MBM7853921.1 energy-coupling factor transport system permease protein [Desulforadius tongensis]
MYSYQDKKLFLQTLHPAAVLAHTGVMFFLSLTCSHPVFLLLLYIILLLEVKLVDGLPAYKNCVLFSIIMLVMIILINPLFGRLGSTVLWSGPVLPVTGRIVFTLEAVLYGINMGMRLLVVITVFFLYNRMMNPDRAFSFLARYAPGSVMLITLATRLVPYLAVQFKNIKEVQQTRGVEFDCPGITGKIKSYYPLLKVLLLSSLENAFNIAEAIQSRGYGSGPRSYYTREKFRPRDVIVLAASGGALLGGMVLMAGGGAEFQFYPQLGPLFAAPGQPVVMIMIGVFLMLPAFLNWGWQYWPYLKWRI